MKKENGVYRKGISCSDLAVCGDEERIFDLFILADIGYCSNERGIKWCNVTLQDRTGRYPAKIWSENMNPDYLSYKGQVVFVSGRISLYGSKSQLCIERLRLAENGSYELTDLVRMLPKDMAESCKAQIRALIGKISDKELSVLCQDILTGDMLKMMAEYPVTVKGHHSYSGGFLCHTAEVATSAYYYAKGVAPFLEEGLDMDLLIAGALLHDIHVTAVLDKEGLSFKEGIREKLYGKRYCSHMMLAEKGVDVPDRTLSILVQLVDSSHEDGDPLTREGFILKKVNRLSAELDCWQTDVQQEIADASDAEFLWSKSLRKEICRLSRSKGGNEDA